MFVHSLTLDACHFPALALGSWKCKQFARLFAKLPQPGDSEVAFSVFKSSFHLLLPV